MTRTLGFLALVLTLGLLPAVGCSRGPSEATEEEGLRSMEDMSSFEDAAAIDESESAPATP